MRGRLAAIQVRRPVLVSPERPHAPANDTRHRLRRDRNCDQALTHGQRVQRRVALRNRPLWPGRRLGTACRYRVRAPRQSKAMRLTDNRVFREAHSRADLRDRKRRVGLQPQRAQLWLALRPRRLLVARHRRHNRRYGDKAQAKIRDAHTRVWRELKTREPSQKNNAAGV